MGSMCVLDCVIWNGDAPYLETQYKVFSWSSGIALDPIALTSFPAIPRCAEMHTALSTCLVGLLGIRHGRRRQLYSRLTDIDAHQSLCSLLTHCSPDYRRMQSVRPLGPPGRAVLLWLELSARAVQVWRCGLVSSACALRVCDGGLHRILRSSSSAVMRRERGGPGQHEHCVYVRMRTGIRSAETQLRGSVGGYYIRDCGHGRCTVAVDRENIHRMRGKDQGSASKHVTSLIRGCPLSY